MAQKTDFNQLSVEPGRFFLSRKDERPKTQLLPPGVYTINSGLEGNWFEAFKMNYDGLVKTKNAVTDELIQDIDKFFQPSTKQRYADFNLIYKRGILMHGKPGTGKSSTIYALSEMAVEKGYIVLFNPNVRSVWSFVTWLRGIEGVERPILVIWEEFEDLLDNGWENNILQLLDGGQQLPSVIYLATTNYLNRIPNRFKNRPSRFAKVIEVGAPSAEVRRTFLEGKLGKYVGDVDLDAWVAESDGFVIDQLKDLIVSCLCLEVPLKEAVMKIKSMQKEADKGDEDDD